LQTGGSAFGDTNTKSNFSSAALSKASYNERIPSFSPFAPIT